MITTTETFDSNFMMHDGDVLNYENYSRAFTRLKLEMYSLIKYFGLDTVQDWNAVAQYNENDVVWYSDSFWVARDTNENTTPAWDSPFWDIGTLDVLFNKFFKSQLDTQVNEHLKALIKFYSTDFSVETEEQHVTGLTDTVTFAQYPKVIFLNGVLVNTSEYTLEDNTVTFATKQLDNNDVVFAITLKNRTTEIRQLEKIYHDIDNNIITITEDIVLSSIQVFVNGVLLKSSMYTTSLVFKNITFIPGILHNDDWVVIQVV